MFQILNAFIRVENLNLQKIQSKIIILESGHNIFLYSAILIKCALISYNLSNLVKFQLLQQNRVQPFIIRDLTTIQAKKITF